MQWAESKHLHIGYELRTHHRRIGFDEGTLNNPPRRGNGMSNASDLSLNEMPIHDHHQDWTDDHITVRYLGFNQNNGEAHFEVIERHDNVGFYYIWVIYGPDSGPPPGPPS